MTREEAILEIDCILFEQDYLKRKEVMRALKQPVTLCDFLGWEEGQEYNWKGTTIKIEKNNIYEKNEKCSSNWCNFYVSGEELLDLRQAKKVEVEM